MYDAHLEFINVDELTSPVPAVINAVPKLEFKQEFAPLGHPQLVELREADLRKLPSDQVPNNLPYGYFRQHVRKD